MDDQTILQIADVAVPALSGLVGVVVGGWLTGRSQRKERRHAWLRRQLDEFYSPMLGLRERILAKSTSRLKVSQAADSAWSKLYDGASVQRQIQLEKEHGDKFGEMITYNNKQLFEELLPLYRKMVDYFSANIGLAEPATRAYFGEFVHFVDIWDRSETGDLPADVSRELGQNEKIWYPFYNDLSDNVQRLQDELKK